MYGFGIFGGDWGGALSDLVRVPFADAMLVAAPAGVAPAVVASASDNIPDGWRTVAPHLAARPGRRRADRRRRRAEHRPLRGRRRPSRWARAASSTPTTIPAGWRWRRRSAPRPWRARRPGPSASSRSPSTPAGRTPGLHAALRSTEPGGVCTSIGIYYEALTPVPLLEMYTTGVTLITGRAMARAAMPAVLERIAAGDLHPERVTSNVVAWEQAAEAVGEAQTKLIIER